MVGCRCGSNVLVIFKMEKNVKSILHDIGNLLVERNNQGGKVGGVQILEYCL